MATIAQEMRVELAKRELLSVADAQGHTLTCTDGELWITTDGDRRDVILRPGQAWRIESNAAVVISALKPSSLRVEHRSEHCSPACAAHAMLWSLRNRAFPPLTAFPAQMIR